MLLVVIFIVIGQFYFNEVSVYGLLRYNNLNKEILNVFLYNYRYQLQCSHLYSTNSYNNNNNNDISITKGKYYNQNTTNNAYIKRNKRNLINFKQYNRFLTISYDHLAVSSLDAIQILPIQKFKKGNAYLYRWWMNAKKWNLLSGDLLDIDKKMNLDDDNKDSNNNNIPESDDFIYKNDSDDNTDTDNDNDSDTYNVADSENDETTVFDNDSNNEIDFNINSSNIINETEEEEEEEAGILEESTADNNDYNEDDINNNSKDDFDDDHLVDDSYEVPEVVNSNEFDDIDINNDIDADLDLDNNSDYNNSSRIYIPKSPNIIKNYQDIANISTPTTRPFFNRTNIRVPYSDLYRLCRNYQARVICISDVHGCIDDLCALLRKVNYRPGDLIVLLGDLVAKGPSSVDVVKFGRDNNVVCVRGNHDHEVIQQGMNYYKNRLSMRPSRSEHFNIALELSLSDLQWLSKSPFYVRSPDLGGLFVHAGFQPHLRLSEQLPLVMMTMRSYLPNRKMSPKCLYEYPWASQWKGPLTVYFGHDAARGLQIYDHAVGLDTGCVYGGNLTAIILPDKQIVSVPAKMAYRQLRKSKSHRMLASSKKLKK